MSKRGKIPTGPRTQKEKAIINLSKALEEYGGEFTSSDRNQIIDWAQNIPGFQYLNSYYLAAAIVIYVPNSAKILDEFNISPGDLFNNQVWALIHPKLVKRKGTEKEDKLTIPRRKIELLRYLELIVIGSKTVGIQD